MLKRAAAIFLLSIIYHTSGFSQPQALIRAVLRQFENEMVLVAGDTFSMGCTPDQGNECLVVEKPIHTVRLDSFYISKYDVTQAQWKAIMNTSPSHFRHCSDCPVENISWNDIQQFINKVNELSGAHYRLPTEAEWEFAARGGRIAMDLYLPAVTGWTA